MALLLHFSSTPFLWARLWGCPKGPHRIVSLAELTVGVKARPCLKHPDSGQECLCLLGLQGLPGTPTL